MSVDYDMRPSIKSKVGSRLWLRTKELVSDGVIVHYRTNI